MGIPNVKEVMLMNAPAGRWLWVFVCVWCTVCMCAATLCPPGEQYWAPERGLCANCTRCDTLGHVVLRPCEVHRDTLCGPLADLEIEWPWLQEHKHHRHHHRRKPHRGSGGNGGGGPGNGGHHDPAPQLDTEHSATDVVTEATLLLATGEQLIAEVTSTEAPFSSTETLVWDWQAVALTLAVFACLLFFLVAGLYSIHQARQWKRLKDNFEADVEELSARLNLMVTSGELADKLEPNTGTINDGNYLSNHCVYLEQLLVRKDSKIGPGNVYIEESNTNTSSSKT